MELSNKVVQGYVNGELTNIAPATMSDNVYLQSNNSKTIDTGLITTYTHTRIGTVNEFTGTGSNGVALLTSDIEQGDTFTLNGQSVIAYMGADNAADVMAGSPWNGKWVTFVTDGDAINFKGGGGKVTVTGLSADVVKQGSTVTVKQGVKTVASVVGTLAAAANPVQMYSNILGAW